MAASIAFTNVQLLSFSRKSTGGTASFSASLTAPVIKAMQWAELPECQTGAGLDGDLAAHQVELTPKEPELQKHAMTLDCKRIHKFTVTRLEIEGKKGKGHRFELRFEVSWPDPNGAQKLEQFIISCGKSILKVHYTKQAVQETLPDTEDDGQEEIE